MFKIAVHLVGISGVKRLCDCTVTKNSVTLQTIIAISSIKLDESYEISKVSYSVCTDTDSVSDGEGRRLRLGLYSYLGQISALRGEYLSLGRQVFQWV
jgi:hypothetical protein